MSEYCRDDFGLVEQADDDFKMWQGLVGPHYTPSVSEDGTLSWSNDGKLPNPEDVNIKGPPGEGEPGPGVPAGGTTGQLLAKASDEDYDGEWIDPPEMDAGQVSYDSTEAYDDGTVGKELTTINSALSSLSAVTEIIDTASGAIASFPDGSGLPMRSLVAQINPVQDLHGYDAPWPAGGGVNIFDYNTFENKLITSDGVIGDSSTRLLSSIFTVTANSAYIVTYPSSGFNFAGHIEYNDSDVFQRRVLIDQTSGSTQITPATNRIRLYFSKDPNSEPISKDDLATAMVTKGTTPPDKFYPYSNECPITGWTGLSGKRCGKNLLRVPYTDGASKTGSNVTYSVNSSGQIEISCSASASGNVDYYLFGGADSTYESTGLKSGTYTFSVSVPSAVTGLQMFAFRDDGTSLCGKNVGSGASQTFTIDSSRRYRIFLRVQSGSSVNTVASPQIEVGSTASTYKPYTSLPITCTWQTEAGTVYGGTVDVVTGVLTVTHRYVLLDGTQTINKHSTSAYNGFHLNLANNGLPACASTEDGTVGQFSYYKLGKLINANGNAFVGSNTIQFRNDSLTTKDEAIAYLTANPLQVVYPLATPQTYQLTPQQISTLLGNNTVFVDTGSVSVTYQASIKGYIDKVLGA